MSTFRCTIEGSAADGQTWSTECTVSVASQGQFREALDEGMRHSFLQLTGGLAQFGRPGVGCRGPYRIRKFVLEELPG